MADTMKDMPQDMKITHKHTATFLSDNIASVIEDHSGTMNKKAVAWKSGALLIKKDGKWKVKEMAEGGWGDMMPEKAAMAPSMGTNTQNKQPMMK